MLALLQLNQLNHTIYVYVISNVYINKIEINARKLHISFIQCENKLTADLTLSETQGARCCWVWGGWGGGGPAQPDMVITRFLCKVLP